MSLRASGLRTPYPFDVIEPGWEGLPACVRAFSTTRSGGISRQPYGGAGDNGSDGGGGLNLGDHVGDDAAAVAANRAIVRNAISPDADIRWLSQVHGVAVCDAAAAADGAKADASSTAQKNTVCAVMTADCLPVLFSDCEGKVVAAAHAGWRGLAAGILDNTVAHMRESGAGDIVAWLGPAIGPTRFEVGEDVLQAFAALPGSGACFVPCATAPGKYYADIYALSRQVLARAGVQKVVGGVHCTVIEKERFYSYRRDGVTGRMASFIWLE
ncbi:peptidoglycan editing factor PgeF [Undibacterium sp. TJN25]|uniref:peptidoglycan editing factor PgeF n=1 Tax=Undibacterium sp. TJN25 TaxID=3413056 RepID=UPI003BF2DB61